MSEQLDVQRNKSLSQQTSLDQTIASGVVPEDVYFIGDTVARSGLSGYYAIQAIEDTTFTALTAALATGSNAIADLAGKTLKAGHVWYIAITAVTLAGGSVLMYKQQTS